MKWLLQLETENDPIPACRVMNIFRRKGVKVSTLALAAQPEGFSLMAVVESAQADADHIFNFLRGAGGVRHVSYYRHEPSADAAFVFIDAGADSSSLARFIETFPDSKLIVASHGQCLLEVPAESRPRAASSRIGTAECVPFARVKTTRRQASVELVGAAKV